MRFTISKSNYSKRLAGWSLALLFPGFYFYHLFVAVEFIPSVLGGFFSPVALGSVILFTVVIGYSFSKAAQSQIYLLLVLAWLIWCFLLSTIGFSFGHEDYISDAYYKVLETLLLWCALILVGLHISFDSKTIRRVFWVSGIAIFAQLIVYAASTGSLFFYADMLYGEKDTVASYQGFARSALIVAYICYALTPGNLYKIAVAGGSLFVLFVLGSRSELAAFTLVLVFFVIIRSLKDRAQLWVLVTGTLVAILGVMFYSDEIFSSRQLELFNLAESSSWDYRTHAFWQAMERISNNPVFGEFGGYFASGGKGSYAHNLLSAWDSFGILGFFVYVFLVSWPCLHSILLLLRRRILKELEVFYILMAISCFLLVIASKSIFSPLPALVWGLYLNLQADEKYKYYFRYRSIVSRNDTTTSKSYQGGGA